MIAGPVRGGVTSLVCRTIVQHIANPSSAATINTMSGVCRGAFLRLAEGAAEAAAVDEVVTAAGALAGAVDADTTVADVLAADVLAAGAVAVGAVTTSEVGIGAAGSDAAANDSAESCASVLSA